MIASPRLRSTLTIALSGICAVAIGPFPLAAQEVQQRPGENLASENLENSTRSPIPTTFDRNAAKIQGRSSAKNATVEAALLEPASLQFSQTPLFGIAGLISERHGIPVFLDRQNLEDEGISLEDEIQADFPEIALGDGLELMLEPYGLGFLVKNGVLMITSRSLSDSVYETRTYDVRGFNMQDPETLADVLTHTTGDDTWRTTGGMGDLSFFKGSFIIRQTREIHQQIETVLNQLLQDVTASPNSPTWPAKDRRNNPQPMSPGGGFGGAAGVQGGGGGFGGGLGGGGGFGAGGGQGFF